MHYGSSIPRCLRSISRLSLAVIPGYSAGDSINAPIRPRCLTTSFVSGSSLTKEMQRLEELYRASEKENKGLRRENAYLRRMLEKYLYPDLAGQLMQEAHLPVRTVGNVTPAALGDLIEGTGPDPFGGAQKAKEKPKTREEQLLDEMRRQAEE